MPSSVTAIVPRHSSEIIPAVDDLGAFEVAAATLRTARAKGLPQPVTTTIVGDRIELGLLWPHLLLWMDVLDGLGQVVDDEGYEHGPHRMAAVPNHRHGDFAVHGWTRVEDSPRRQQWVLRPVNESGCDRCADLPEPSRQPLGVDAWFAQRWFELTGCRWEQRRELGR